MYSKRPLGPLDVRHKVTRCQQCARRKIKCEGGIPCRYCQHMEKNCEPQQRPSRKAGTGFIVLTGGRRSLPQTLVRDQVMEKPDERFLDSFVAFLGRNRFTRRFSSVHAELMPLVYASPVLYHVGIAIGALDASRKGAICKANGPGSLRLVSFASYHKAVIALQKSLVDDDATQRDDVLWGTFLLGVYELISEKSGEAWATHMLYGTSTLLQVMGPSKAMTPLRRSLYEAFRVLEASRAIIFSSDTMLSGPGWKDLHQTSWCPFDSVTSLAVYISSFSKDFFETVEDTPEQQREADPCIQYLGTQGLEVQKMIFRWHQDAIARAHVLEERDPYFQLAVSFYHALHLFLAGNFGYYPYWDRESAPFLLESEINAHVTDIIDIAEKIVDMPDMPVVLLCFPLRLAGSNARSTKERLRLWKILDQIYWKGFVVSARIKTELEEFWQYQGVTWGDNDTQCTPVHNTI